jgi:hypothetical protein
MSNSVQFVLQFAALIVVIAIIGQTVGAAV